MEGHGAEISVFSEECKILPLKSVAGVLNFGFSNEQKNENNEHFYFQYGKRRFPQILRTTQE